MLLLPRPIPQAAAVAAFLLFSSLAQAAPPPGAWNLTFTDDFSTSALDPAKWTAGPRDPSIINNELQAYRPENVTVANGICVIKAEKRTAQNLAYGGHTGRTMNYASGEIITYNKWTQAYGYFEARVKMATGAGTWPAFWLLPDRGTSVTPLDHRVGIGTRGGAVAMGNEFDIFEYMGTWKNQSTGLSKSHSGYFWDYSGGSSSAWTMVNQLVSPDTQFHTYGMAWSPSKLVFYIDDVAVATKYGRTTVGSCPHYIILNLALSTNDWVNPDPLPLSQIDAGLPCAMEVDYVKVYQGSPAPTPIVNGTYEAESIVTAPSSDSQKVATESAASNGAYDTLAADAAGDYISYSVPVAQPGTYNVKVQFKRAALSTSNRGQWQLSVDGMNQGNVQDEYGSGIFVAVDLGNVAFTTAGNKTFKFTVTGKNASSQGYNVNFDYIKLTPVSTLPSPWTNQDIGGTGVAGSSSYLNGNFTINGSGVDISGTADSFQYVYQMATGDCSVVAKVDSLTQTDYNAKAGVMMRESLTANSPHAFMYIPKLNKAAFASRGVSGGTTTFVPNGATIIHPPNWVKLTRVGNVFTGSFSTDGVNWTQVGSQTIAMPSTIYFGLPVTSRVNTTLTTAVVSNVTAVP